MRTDRLFVYGTLRSGGLGHRLLDGCTCDGEAMVRGTLYDVGGRYPALVLEGEGAVWGERWTCPEGCLAAVDGYEGVEEGLFRRVRVEAGGQRCWTYVAGPLLLPRLRPERVIGSGRWPPR